MAKAKKNQAEADDAEEQDGEAGAAKRKLPLKLIIIVAAAAVVLIGGGTGTYLMFSGKKADEKHAEAAVKPVAFMDVPDLVVNLAGTAGERIQYLKIKVVLEVPDQAVATQIQPLLPRLVDAFQTYLRELRLSDLEGSSGLYRMREELTRRVNASIAPSRINAVLFKEIVVQ
jgi:flagellar FliL protein